MNDAKLRASVIRELQWDSRVDEGGVRVDVRDGIVTLTGTVPSWARRLAAAEAAHRVHGVLDVANDIKVGVPGPRTQADAEIAKAVRFALEWDVFVPHERIHTTVSDGLVTLKGTVDHHRQKENAGRAISNLEGVRAVINEIEVRPVEARPAIELR